MSRARIHNFSILLDGFATGEGQALETPIRHAGHRLHEWLLATRFAHRQVLGEPGGTGERRERPILVRQDGQRLDRRTAHRWVKAIGKRAGLGHVHPHMLRGAFIMAALDAGVPLRDVQLAARHADLRTTTIYDRRRENFDRHAAYVVVVAFVAGA